MFIPNKEDEKNKLEKPGVDSYYLYGWEQSYFTRKLEAALIFYGADFQLRPKTLENRREVQLRSGTHQVPVLHTPENWMIADTTPIIRMLDDRFPGRAQFPDGELGVLVHLIEEYFDEWIARTSVHWRWNYPENYELLSMSAADGDPEIAAQIVNWGVRVCRATGVSSEIQQQEAENEYHRIMEAAEAQLQETNYLLGDRPTAADAIFLGGLRAHFNFDPAPRKAVHDRYPVTIAWCEQGADQWDGSGELAPFPESTPFAQFMLKEMESTYQRFALSNRNALLNKQKAFVINVYGEEVSYLARPYIEQSRQMIVKRVQELPDRHKEKVTAWLEANGLLDLIQE
ncbi:MAG: glutathione S-transferase family protein [Chloroflexota bacterium]